MKTSIGLLILGFFTITVFQNCGGKKVDFVPEEAALPSQSFTLPDQEVEEQIALKNKSLSFYGTRIQGQVALIAELSEATTLPLTVSLSKNCGTLDDTQISGNAALGKFIFTIPAGKKQSDPVVLSSFPSGQIVWQVKIQVSNTGSIVTDIVQACSPWLSSGGGNLCPAPSKQPYCIDRG